jgi:glutaredoxin
MNSGPRRLARVSPSTRWALSLLLVAAGVAQAQYKVVGPDGKITYTDRAPTANEGKITAIGGRSAAAAPDVPLPAELRPVVARYPVTLFVTSAACEPCNAARQLLRQRGIPFTEKLIVTPEDGDALERLSGGRDAPTMTVGGQTLRGLAGELWNSYLDAAGYPRESRLPANYQYPAATPLTERREAAAARPAAAPRNAPVDTEPAPAPSAPGGVSIKF